MTKLEGTVGKLIAAFEPRKSEGAQPACSAVYTRKVVVTVAMIVGAFVFVLTLNLGDAWAYDGFEWLEDHEEGVYYLSDSKAVLRVGFDYGDDGTDLSFRWFDPQGNSTTACPEWDWCTTGTYVYSGGVRVGKKVYLHIEEQDRMVGTYAVEVHQWGYSDPIFTDTFEIQGPTIYLPLVQASNSG